MSKNNGKLLDFMNAVFSAVEEYVKEEAEEYANEESGKYADAEEKTVNLYELAMIVADETGMKARCVYDILRCAFVLIKELELTVIVEDDDDECEIEED